MFVHITPSLCVNSSHIISMTLLPGPTTEFRIRGYSLPITAQGNWIKKIEKAEQVKAVFVHSTHHTLRS